MRILFFPEASKIKQTRHDAGLSQETCAQWVYVTTRTWQNWENGSRKMHLGLWELFLRKLNGARRTLVLPEPKGKEIEAWRLARQLSVEQCAQLVYVRPSTWIKWEQDYSAMPKGLWELIVLKWASALESCATSLATAEPEGIDHVSG